MIDRKDLKVGLVTEEWYEVTAIGTIHLLYRCGTTEYAMDIDNFCRSYSIKKEKIEVVRWVNIYSDAERMHLTRKGAEHCAGTNAIAVAVKMVGSYEV